MKLKLETEIRSSYVAYLVVLGSKTHKPHVVRRYVREDEETQVDPIKAAYDGDVIRIIAHAYYGNDKLTPCYGVFATPDAAGKYADRLFEVICGKSEGREGYGYFRGNVEKCRHMGKHLYCGLRKGLWTFHFPTWKEHVQMCKEYDELDDQGVFSPSPHWDGERMAL